MFDLRVLYAEDEEAIRSIFARVLGKLVIELYVAEDGEEALRLYKEHRPDIIITDVRMPKMTGFEMVSVVRSENKIIPIVAVTAHNDAEHFLEAIRLGVTSFLVKPIDTDELIKTLEYVNNIVKLQKENTQKTLQLEEALIKARLAEKAKGDFLAAMSHEIRTPLNAILGFTELLKDVDNKALRDEYLAIIESNGKNLLYIINDILDYSKIESGSFEIENIEFEPLGEFEPVVDLFAIKAYEKKIELLSFIDPRLPKKLIGDPLRIRQILSNLLSNALKFTPENKNIFINITTVDTSDSHAKILFEVKDEGIGISKEKLKTIFNPFSQAEAGTARKYGGTGLGLSISSSLSLLMNSILKVESEVGVGSRFWFELELDIVEMEPSIQLTGKKAFICKFIENENIKELLKRYLESMNINVLSEPIGVDVAFLSDNASPDLICNNLKKVKLTNDPFLYEDKNAVFIMRPPLSATKIKKSFTECEKTECFNTTSNSHIDVKTDSKILVADDNSINQKLITAVLKKYGIDTVLASNGREAVELFFANEYPLVFVDIQMPIMDGIEAMRAMKKKRTNAKIVALTAHANSGDREMFLQEGFDGYLQKPLDEKELVKILKVVFADKQTDYFAILQEALGLERSDIAQLLEEFVIDFASELAMMREAVNEKRMDNLFEVSHKVKGAAANLRLEDIRKIAYEIEQNAKEKNLSFDYTSRLDKLEKCVASINFKEF